MLHRNQRFTRPILAHNIPPNVEQSGAGPMLRTIMIGSSVFIQGTFLKDLGDGQIAIKVFDGTYVGRPVTPFKVRETADA
jgi:hypothetical protein